MTLETGTRERFLAHLWNLYPQDVAEETCGRLAERVESAALKIPARRSGWDQGDAVLITYGDQVSQEGEPPLATLRRFLLEKGLGDLLSGVHILPFFPYSSDDGFSVIDYRRIDPALGDWPDLAQYASHFDLMVDLVVNHCSRESAWFEGYLEGVEPYTSYFIEADPAADLSRVTRPRSHPLLTPVETSRGVRHVWTTFSADQVDLNFRSPAVLLEMIDILLFYLQKGVRIIRLDAIAYLWKTPGTSCIHLPETHEVVRLMRTVVDAAAPGTILLTETNVPHRENVSYFGSGDEAQMVYQFSLAPLLLEALITGEATVLRGWLEGLDPTPPGTTVFNFTASHDGVGVRPLEGLLPGARFERLIDAVRSLGGRVSTKRNSDGSESPYELNISYFGALADPEGSDPAGQVRRFITSQALMLSLKGIPGIYFHSLVATPNDLEGAARTGRARSINRRKYKLDELEAILADGQSPPARVLAAYRMLLSIRREQAAFHPDAAQRVVPASDKAVVAFVRESSQNGQRILVAANLGRVPASIDAEALLGTRPQRDLLGGPAGEAVAELGPWQIVWLEA